MIYMINNSSVSDNYLKNVPKTGGMDPFLLNNYSKQRFRSHFITNKKAPGRKFDFLNFIDEIAKT